MRKFNEIIQIFYKDPARVCSINEISRLLSWPYGTVYNYVQSLINEGVLKFDTRGKATLCRLNLKSQKAIELLSFISVSEKENFAKGQGVLLEALNELAGRVKEKSCHNIFTMILFGSVAKGIEKGRSDIDLFFISSSKNKYDEMIENECNALRMSYGRDVNPIIAEPNMYINMLKEKGENVGKQILKAKVIFYGANKYWELTLEGLSEEG